MATSNKANPPGLAYPLLVAVFAGLLVIASVTAAKIVTIFGLFVPAGVIAYCFTFVVTDVVGETWGKDAARRVVTAGFFALVVALIAAYGAVLWPAAPFYKDQEAFTKVVGQTSRIMVASLLAYLLSQYHDVWVFHAMSRATSGRHLWLRNTLSTALSQLIDSAVFITIAFYGVMPVLPLIWGQWVVKLAFAAIDTPIVYLLVHLLKKRGRHAAGLDA